MTSRLHSDLYPTYDVRVFPGSRARGIKIRTCSRLFGVFNITITVVICGNKKRYSGCGATVTIFSLLHGRLYSGSQ